MGAFLLAQKLRKAAPCAGLGMTAKSIYAAAYVILRSEATEESQ